MTTADKSIITTSPKWLRIASAIGVLWFIFGFSQFLKNMTMDVAGAVANGRISEAHGAAITATPLLIWVAYFFACLFGLLGAVQLFRGHASATMLFVLSLILDIIYFGWFHVSGTAAARPTEAGVIAIVVITVTLVFAALSFRNFKQA